MEIFAFLFSLGLTYFLIKRINMFGHDLHKKDKKKIPEMGGIAPLLSNILFIPFIKVFYIIPIVFSGLLGIIDDISKLKPKEKLIFLFIFSLIFGYFLYINGFISLWEVLLLAVSITVFSNLTNMLAGFNGLEIGLGIISSFFLAIFCYIYGYYDAYHALLIFSASYFGLFIYNKYPAKVFPGDVGTLPIGAFLSTLAVIYHQYIPFLIIMTPYIVDASLKFITAGVMSRDEHKPTVLGEDNKLYYISGYLSLPRLILKFKPMKEWQLVVVLYIIEIIFCIIALIFVINSKFI
ncbi:N-acetylglucosamine-1-phosphate transferase [Methanocaldococcus villosus KIN24-T80]|uniref:N-acetylglucosamine-1-phosphate transferase n=1 Tax=Methanocaldococcus villosus KIN24-T80 TaxID=1069083 RepID=N6UWE1_9EURY|nr:N-acetylglucosamine-1-phosphate transferase [Methanocaldococcus villosus]ENN96629.1 N-acetylglucosamine-1-phosphate transferase [Methanocaldococcus villosus KIN24-T80]